MNYINITKNDMVNGDGLRVVLWVAGCSHNCPQCQNPQTHNKNAGTLFDEEAIQEIFDELKHDYVDGITLSGGDPLFISNREEMFSLVMKIKESFPNKTIWVYTGYKWEQVSKLPIMKYIDVLVDGKFDVNKNNPSPKWCGSYNQRVIDVPSTISSNIITTLYNNV